VHRPKYHDWSYPKGKCLPDEHVLAAVVREVREETGLGIMLGRPLTRSVYQVNGGTKEVSYWAAQCVRAPPFAPNQEVDRVDWLPVPQARQLLTYPRDVALLDELGSAPVRTVPFILLRHAAAGRKSSGSRGGRGGRGGRVAGAGDLTRPLDRRGAEDAQRLAGLLASYGRCRVLSSPAERCLATVRPYAAAVGAAVEVEPAFTVPPAGDGELSGQAAQRAAAAAASGVPTLVCAHRENLPVLTGAAFAVLGAAVPPLRPLRKSGFLVLQSAGGALVSSERHDVAG